MSPSNSTSRANQSPHANQPVLHAGPPPEKAAATLILIHGRGASAESMLTLYRELDIRQLAALAPQAANNTWYPHSFLAPIEANQPWLDSALAKIESIIAQLLAAGIPSQQIALLGFSQGACLTSEFIARNPRRYGAAMILTGGLIGPEGTPRNYPGNLNGTPIFMGTSDIDPHVPLERAQETEEVLRQMGAEVELQVYPNMPHTINADEFETCRNMLTKLVSSDQ
jgi:predicted esterase